MHFPLPTISALASSVLNLKDVCEAHGLTHMEVDKAVEVVYLTTGPYDDVTIPCNPGDAKLFVRITPMKDESHDLYVVLNSVWPTLLERSFMIDRPQSGALVVKYVRFFRR